MPSPWSKQPLRLLYLLFIVPATLTSVAYVVASGIFRGLRPDPTWPFQKSAAVLFVKQIFLRHLCALRMPAPLSMEPGSEGDRFVVIPPAKEAQITGPASDAEIKPAQLGGTWTPAPSRQINNMLVLLHFHGGAYVMGNGRDADTGFVAQTLLQNTPFTHVFTPQYRLSNNPGGRFPAALQDGLSAFSYLVNDLGIPATNIVLSGDSAGANLAIAMLRYIANYGPQTGLPWPKAALLWSPWVDVASALDPRNMESHRNYSTDYLHSAFGNWGAEALTGFGAVSAEDPYLSPVRSPFHIGVPVWVQTSGKEVFYDDNVRFVKAFREMGTNVDFYVEEDAPHDIIMMGARIGFVEEAKRCAVKAGEFLKRIA
ncbi:hypothetical protein HG530_015227 [Fusarium avenaceum]|nr:hypothetical protein HG530_015227 [Fusarium avenaceum]